VLAWAAIVVQLAFAPLALWRRTRPWAWAAALLATAWCGFSDAAGPAWGLAALHAFTFDPAWVSPRRVGRLRRADADEPSEPSVVETVFYDGHCGLCHASVRFILAEDPHGTRFDFAPLQSVAFERAVPAETRATLPDSVIVHTHDGRLLVKSTAAAHILARLGGLWRITSWLLAAIPRPIRDFGYDCVARVRRRLFAQPQETCPMMPAATRARFRS
jgi:predicted DCC family thiol-disulfide oxidoreductase YuxK